MIRGPPIVVDKSDHARNAADGTFGHGPITETSSRKPYGQLEDPACWPRRLVINGDLGERGAVATGALVRLPSRVGVGPVLVMAREILHFVQDDIGVARMTWGGGWNVRTSSRFVAVAAPVPSPPWVPDRGPARRCKGVGPRSESGETNGVEVVAAPCPAIGRPQETPVRVVVD